MKRRAFQAISISLGTLLLAAAFPVAAQSTVGDGAGHTQADSFLASASRALAAGSVDQARRMVESALELSPDYSEALYLRARLEQPDRNATAAAVADLRAALKAGSWTATDPSLVEQTLADILVRTGAFGEARSLLLRLSETHPEDPRNADLRAHLLARTGAADAEARVLVDAIARFPLVDDFRLMYSRILTRETRHAAAVGVVASGLKVHPDSLPLLLESARLELNPRTRAEAVDLYVRKGGGDPLSALIGLEALSGSRARYLALFLRQGGLVRQDLVDRAITALAGSEDLTRSLQDSLSGYTGERVLDGDGDGFWEDRWSFAGGQLTQWRREPAQDGVARYEAQFANLAPTSITYFPAPGRAVTLRYSRYPFVDTAVEDSGSTLFLAPYSTSVRFLQDDPSGNHSGLAVRIAPRLALPSLDTLGTAAYRREDYAAGGSPLSRMVLLSRGQPTYMEEDMNSDGVIDHKVWYVGGRPVRGERALTAEGDFRVQETWRDGKLVGEAVDTDGDGKIDFRQTYGQNPAKLWDFNEDGRDDSRETAGPGGTIVREFSTALNGVFDLRIVFRNGRIEQVTAAGRPLPVTMDESRGVSWIGPAAASGAAPDGSLPDGVQILGGKSFLVFRYQGALYAEAAP